MQVDKPADRLDEVEVETLGESVVKLEARKVLETLGEKLAEMQVHTTQKESC